MKETDGFTYFSAAKPFANADEAKAIFNEISGTSGPFRDFSISRSRSFARTKFHFAGTVDFSGGLQSFSDSELAQQLDGQPLGEDVKAIEARINDTLDNVFQIHIAVYSCPAMATSNLPGRDERRGVAAPPVSAGRDHAGGVEHEHALVHDHRDRRSRVVAVGIVVVPRAAAHLGDAATTPRPCPPLKTFDVTPPA